MQGLSLYSSNVSTNDACRYEFACHFFSSPEIDTNSSVQLKSMLIVNSKLEVYKKSISSSIATIEVHCETIWAFPELLSIEFVGCP